MLRKSHTLQNENNRHEITGSTCQKLKPEDYALSQPPFHHILRAWQGCHEWPMGELSAENPHRAWHPPPESFQKPPPAGRSSAEPTAHCPFAPGSSNPLPTYPTHSPSAIDLSQPSL